MHDGVYGRNHLYSYVNDNDTWWKTVDWVVTEVSTIHLLLIEGPTDIHPSCVFPIGFGRDSPDGPDRLTPRRRALHAHLQPRHSRRGPRAPAMARRSCGTCRAPPFPFPFFFLSHKLKKLALLFLHSGTFSATIRFSLEKSHRVIPRVKQPPSDYLFRRLRPYPASRHRWKYPSLLERPWMCPIE